MTAPTTIRPRRSLVDEALAIWAREPRFCPDCGCSMLAHDERGCHALAEDSEWETCSCQRAVTR